MLQIAIVSNFCPQNKLYTDLKIFIFVPTTSLKVTERNSGDSGLRYSKVSAQGSSESCDILMKTH